MEDLNVQRGRALVIDDDPDMHLIINEILLPHDFVVNRASSAEEGIITLGETDVDIVFLDHNLPGISGLEAIKQIKKVCPHCQVIMMTAYARVSDAVTAIKSGAFDYLTKPISPNRVELMAEHALKVKRLEIENIQLRGLLVEEKAFGGIISHSQAMKSPLATAKQVAPLDSSVIIFGESGTGKELLAGGIHSYSQRKDEPIIAINCAALSEDLLSSSLFGFEKGAFTGAFKTNKGCFETAANGTLFLDEVGDMSQKLQSSLLRVLQEREFCRIGSFKTIKANFRLITATNKNMEEEVASGAFREDLYYRLKVIPIQLPPLRDRKEDIPSLVEHFLRKHNATNGYNAGPFSNEAMNALRVYNWPGNIRELINVVEYVVATKRSGKISVDDLPGDFDKYTDENIKTGSIMELPYSSAKQMFELKYLKRWFTQSNRNISQISKSTKIPRSNLYNKLKRHGLI